MNRTMRTAVLVVAVATAGCDENIKVNEPADCLGVCLKVDPRFHEFGDLYAGESAEQTFVLDSWGTDPVEIDAITFDGSDSLSLDTSGTAMSLSTGESTSVTVEWAPTTDEVVAVSLHILSNAAENPDLAIPLTGTALAALAEIDQESWDFGDEEVGCEKARPITVRNVGSLLLVIEGVELDGDASEWYESHAFEDGVILEPLDLVSISVYYTPQDDEADQATLHILTNDVATPDATVTFDGTGHYADDVQDEYLQHAAPWVDILWVIDNTDTMGPYQDQLVSEATLGIPALIAEMTAQGVELFHMAVVTTDNPQMQGSPAILTSGTPDPVDLFTTNALVGTDGAWYERGLDYAVQALTPPMTDPGGPNEGFLRDSAALRVIFLSDDEDSSSGGVLGFIDDLEALEPDPAFLKVAAITGGQNGCTGPAGKAIAAPRYEQAVALTEGLSISVCDPGWFTALATMPWLSPTAAGTFALSRDPIDGTISVAIDGAPLGSGWSYDAAQNAVVLEAASVPELGATVTIDYTPLGSCS